MKQILAKALAKIARNAAFSACGAASQWNAYQPQEPSCLKKW